MAPIDRRPSALAYAGLALSTVGWASAFLIGKAVVEEMTPLPVAVWRYAVAAAVLLPFAVRARPTAGLRAESLPLAGMVLCGGVLYPWLFLQALVHTTATNTALLVALNPAFTALLAPLVGEPLDGRRVAGIALALAGAAMVIAAGASGGALAFRANTGDACALAAAASWAVFNLGARRVVGRLSASFTNCVVYTIGCGVLALLGRQDHPWAQLVAATPWAIGGILSMALLSSVMAGQLFLFGVRTVGVTRTVVFVYLVPVLTAALSVALLGEALHLGQAVGGTAVLAGVWVTTRAA